MSLNFLIMYIFLVVLLLVDDRIDGGDLIISKLMLVLREKYS